MVKLTHFAIENIVVNCKIVELLQWMNEWKQWMEQTKIRKGQNDEDKVSI